MCVLHITECAGRCFMCIHHNSLYIFIYIQVNFWLSPLKNSWCGCYTGTKYMGSLSYADDIFIITANQTPSWLQLQT